MTPATVAAGVAPLLGAVRALVDATDPKPVVIVDNEPSIVDWLVALGTVGAVVVALGIGVIEYLRGREDRREDRAERRRAQALLVNAWLEVDLADPLTDGPRMTAVYRVQNASRAPVYDFVVRHPPGFRGPASQLSYYGVLVPTEGAHGVGRPEAVSFADDSDVQLEHSFRDASGRWWRRGTDGVLQELRGDPYPEGR